MNKKIILGVLVSVVLVVILLNAFGITGKIVSSEYKSLYESATITLVSENVKYTFSELDVIDTDSATLKVTNDKTGSWGIIKLTESKTTYLSSEIGNVGVYAARIEAGNREFARIKIIPN